MPEPARKAKYQIHYTPDKEIPAGLYNYIRMVVRRSPRLWAFLIVTDIIHALRYPVSFYLVGIVIDHLLQSGSPTSIPPEVWFYATMIAVVLFVGELCHAGPHYLTFRWMERARAELRTDMLAYALDHSYAYFQVNFAGGLSRKISEGIEKLLILNLQIRWEILLPIVGMLTSSLLLFSVSWVFGLLVLAFVGCIVVPVLLRLRKIMVKTQVFSDLRSRVSGQIVDTMSNVAAVKAYANEAQELSEHRDVSESEVEAWHKMIRVLLMLDNYRRLTLVLFGSGMMFACIAGWQHGLISVGEIATIMGITFNFTALAWIMSFGIIHVAESLGYLNDTLQTIIRPHYVTDAEDADVLQVDESRIDFENVTFEYGENRIFRELNLTIRPCERIGLIGPSGAGKTTLVNLLQRLFDVQGGRICIDGQDIAKVTQHSLRSNIALIPQDTSLFHRTLTENIRYGRLDATDEEVIEAAKAAHAHEFITKLPEGYETMVGERGVKLSGGQRQRIAIARAILKDAPILILDEATSALDSESEKRIQESLHELMKGRTVIAIAHRLSTISHMDRLVVMEEGQIMEEGSHKPLLKQGGIYARLWNMQSGGFLPE